jgi:hypothetical protein
VAFGAGLIRQATPVTGGAFRDSKRREIAGELKWIVALKLRRDRAVQRHLVAIRAIDLTRVDGVRLMGEVREPTDRWIAVDWRPLHLAPITEPIDRMALAASAHADFLGEILKELLDCQVAGPTIDHGNQLEQGLQ